MAFELFIGGRYLRAKRREAFASLITVLSLCGVGLGVTALIVVIAVMTGAEAHIKERILGSTPHVIVMPGGMAQGMGEYMEARKEILQVPGVLGAAPFIQSQAMIRSRRGASGALLRGVNPALSNEIFDLKDKVEPPGAWDRLVPDEASNPEGRPGIILGKEMASNLNVIPGDVISIISPSGTLSPVGMMPTMQRLEVVGVFSGGMYEYDSTLAWMDMKQAQKFLRMGDTVSGMEVRVKDIYKADRIASEITGALGPMFWATDWMRMNKNLFEALKMEKRAMFVILILIVLVAAFNISTTLIMMVTEKRKDIAILKAMGATKRSILKIFVLNGMFIGIVGTALGISIGTLLCTILEKYQFIKLDGSVYLFDRLPVKMEMFDVLVISGAALLICLLATLYPAWRASRLDPVEIIRYG
ncbi:lipoprotein releasing system, transmembrane protein, LolC/E family [Desulfatibacillum aliphaticivorans]|uniref:Lipoprotein releasing system, transmembrane protein, LolC/E family n=1 Tax=Desulfatibacillum aliphaticivorans TaxID=218208 RepID=B8FFS7_DESAL|nr:lipoprotein-releasing ABC transporter permease subunit [Desulfatibacillum aliphaticivorans]ACL03482.1 lipoprotein releasing system, transmembrane protein, LolC/E family [Desulfatibacillum aliphaticivorans]